MKLDLMYYCQNDDLPDKWILEGCRLGNINLIVGKNASGKTKTLRAINLIASLLSGEVDGTKMILLSRESREWTLIFDSHDDTQKRTYVLKFKNGKVVEESFTIGSKKYLDRNQSGEGRVWAEKLQEEIDFQTPIYEVAALKRRDSIQHPFFEELYVWASSLRYYQFGTELGKRKLMLNTKDINSIRENIDFKNTGHVVNIFVLGKEELGDNFIDAIKLDMGLIGYKISEIGTKSPISEEPVQEGDLQCLYIQEVDLFEKTEQRYMSQGLFRALSLIIQINYSLLAEKPSCILIDDIGEGLDFERASAMIKVLISKAESGLVQLIMTTNDRFIMNGVPLEYWSVIERKSGLARLHNTYNSKQVFDDFKFTGLNNFDFFSSQFYLDGFGEEEIEN
ncbi:MULTISPECIES: AAA family ATPase [Pseudanabaena]|jgi:energy-coupling factor transporter ATP-binding protein EcfA2|uniref:AAA family ATPase n=1 Tax=Pseudanabaena TaxID=1152 RepID=UPI002478D156|nr:MULTISPECIES: AAA family ATPase [Pseudanabaena]MEA5486208.1 AAA family ATPase [Pseudanabaena sp. CCNP1317]WGS70582.1 AAA family ATPase [Pseudanabaena galeata CCNP1313]